MDQSKQLSSRGARTGFTLIEVLVVVVIMGIIAVIASSQFRESIDRAHNAGSMSNSRLLQVALESWKTDYNGLPGELVGSTPDAALAADNTADAANWPTAYTPGALLPRSPWANSPQLVMDPSFCNATPSTVAAGLLAGDIDVESLMATGFGDDGGGNGGSGTQPDPVTGPVQRSDFGYLYYAGDQDSGIYYIFASGKSDTDALLVAIKSNE